MLERTVATKFAFTTKKQGAFGTAIGDADLTLAHPLETDEIAKESPEKWTDQEAFGKGHEFATFQKALVSDSGFSFQTKGSSLMLGWVFAFLCGSVTTSQPDATGAPNTYEHEFTLMDIDNPAVGKQLPATSLVQMLTSFQKTKYRDLVLKKVTISGKRKEHIMIQGELKGSGYWETSSLSMPDLAQVSFLRTADIVNFKLAADENYAAKLISFEFSGDNSLDENCGYSPSSGFITFGDQTYQIRNKLPVDTRSVSLKFRVEMEDDTLRQYSQQNTKKSLTITAEGDVIEDTYNHKLELTVENAYLKTSEVGKEGKFYVYDVELLLCWDNTIKSPFKAVVVNDIPAYLVAAA